MRTAIVTGAGAGIGRACAERFAREGCRVLVADLSETTATRSRAAIEAAGGTALAAVGDVTDPDFCLALRDRALEAWGRIDVLVPNAGIQLGGALVDATPAHWERILAVNLRAVGDCCAAVLPAMAGQGAGAIVMVSSVNALRGSPGMPVYDASKAALLGLMRSLATDYASAGIRVNAVCPGTTITDFHIERLADQGIDEQQIREMTRGYGLLGRAAEPAEVAAAVWFLASDDASFVTGQALVVDGGFSVIGGDA